MNNATHTLKPSTLQRNTFNVFEGGAFICGHCRAFNNAGARICGCGGSRAEIGEVATPSISVDDIKLEW